MSDPNSATSVADRQAIEWHVRLGERPVSADTLQAFKTWRETPGNAEAYQKVERLWRATGTLSADAQIQDLTRTALQTSRPGLQRGWPRRFMPAAAVLAPAVIAVLVLALWLPSRGLYATEIGGQRVVALDDGTRVRLDTDSRIRVRFTSNERRVVLEQGQALFTVAHDAARPFRVDAGGAEITALGTVFDVRREATGARVTLVEGSVAVTDGRAGAGAWRLTPGQQVQTSRSNPTPVAVDAAVETSWSQGHLVFRGTPLRVAVAEVNRYLPGKIVLEDVAAANVPVNGQFATGDRDAFTAAVSDLFDLTARPLPDGGVRLTARSAGG